MNTIRKRFDKNCPSWDELAKFNEMFLQAHINHHNDLLRARGFVFLRDIYECLGFEITKESCIYGWVKGVLKDADFVKISYSRIGDTSDFELEFECYPILEYLAVENGTAE